MKNEQRRRGVLFISNVPSPYNVSYLNELGKLMPVTAVFERDTSSERDKSWQEHSVTSFELIILKGIKTGVDSAFSLGVISHIRRMRNRTIIIANPAMPTGIAAILYCKLKRIPYVLQSEGGIAKDGKGFKERIKYFLMHGAEYYLSGMSLKNEYFLTYGAKPQNVYQYPFTSLYSSDISQSVLTPNEKKEARNALGINADCMVVYVGQFIYRKAVDVLLKACKDLDERVYVLIIGGTPTDEYNRIISELDLKNIHFSQYMDKQTLLKYYAASDVFVLPTREDTWGLVVNEAMATGLPVITTTSCVAGNELIADGINGYLVQADDVLALSDRINSLVSDPDLRYQMGQNNLSKIKDYTFENMAKTIADVITAQE